MMIFRINKHRIFQSYETYESLTPMLESLTQWNYKFSRSDPVDFVELTKQSR